MLAANVPKFVLGTRLLQPFHPIWHASTPTIEKFYYFPGVKSFFIHNTNFTIDFYSLPFSLSSSNHNQG